MTEWRYLRTLFRGARLWNAAAYLLLALTWGAGIGLLALSGWFITATALAGAGLLLALDIFTPSAGIRAAAIVRTVARYGERVVGHQAVLRILARLRGHAFAAIARLPAEHQRALRSGDLQQRLTGDIDTLDAVPLRVTGPMVAAVLAVFAAAALAIALAPAGAALLILGTAAMTLAAAMAAARQGRKPGRELVRAHTRERIALLDYFGGLADLLAYGRLSDHQDALHRQAQAQARRRLSRERVGILAEQGVQLLVTLAALAMLGVCLHWYLQGVISAPVAVLLSLLTLGLNEALAGLPGAWWQVGESLEAVRRLQALAPGEPAPTPRPEDARRPSPADHGPPEHHVRVHRLAVGFDPRRPILEDLEFTLEPGRPLVIDGASGRGKSCLLDTLAGELPPLSGDVRLGGRSLTSWPEHVRYQYIGYLPQETVLLDDTLAFNLRLGRADLDDRTLWAALRQVGLADALRDQGRGLDDRVGEQGHRLSGGQARRVALAWLMLRDSPVALLDEPFSGLDADTETRVLEGLVPWLEARRAVIVTHGPARLPGYWPRMTL
ncbi:thiol reductant ABC exporter subunit CydC [Thioalkalivibrio thiocyanodenitrificans]|uniref:thiol reductant ABC exporter subunit CydC n=1 Tax=Thioalkalivibrio thiocyanodenitrificans TaxID=243063 RepID=UPI0003631073|nr:thiol reductant ABC exporter subunit CydC [Thioalkalivibrio thiocyanodenitrificans]